MVKPPTICVALALLCCILYQANAVPPQVFSFDEKYPPQEETEVCGNIRDVIRRNSARFRKILVRNTNPYVAFLNDDCRRMTARAKSKLDVLASRVMARWGNLRLKVIRAWTDQVTEPNSLHYEGRAVRLQTSDGDRRKLGALAGLAAESGFDWVHYKSRDFVHASVFRDVCQTSVDMAFIIDESGSVGRFNFDKVKAFIKNIVDFFNIGVDGTHVAVTTYSTNAYTDFNLRSSFTKSGIKAAVDRISYAGGWTYTAYALDHVRRTVFNVNRGMRPDPGIPKVAVLLTDGYSNGNWYVGGPAKELRDAGVNVFCIGIGNYNLEELQVIASPPINDHVYRLTSFSDLAGWVDKLSAVSCDEGASISSCDDTITTVESDVFKYFRIEASDFTGAAVDIEVKDIEGVSHLYASLTSKNPGPVDGASLKNESNGSPKALSLKPSSSSKLVYVAVQGQQDVNKFMLSIWDALFKSSNFLAEVTEEQGRGVNVITVRSEHSGSYRYSISEGNEDGKFIIDPNTAKITSTGPLDREVKSAYRLRVLAQDVTNRCRKGRTDVVVVVKDINDNTPEFERSSYQGTILEGRPSGTSVAAVKATDKDAGDNAKITYSITAGDTQRHFRIDAQGKVTTAAVLDFEVKSSYRLTITAKDGGQPDRSAATVLNIVVQNRNEPPEFTTTCAKKNTCVMKVKENQPASTRVGFELLATDPDNDPNCKPLKYKIKTEQSQTNVFKITNTGQISTVRELDREARDQYVVLVTVEDCSRPALRVQTRVKIAVEDENDESPTFPQNYKVSYSEGSAAGSLVTQVIAKDNDMGNNAKISYKFSPNSDSSKFKIDGNGAIKTKVILDRETKETYSFDVIATDGGATPLTGRTTVTITILDVNDNPPEFTQPSYSTTVAEDSSTGAIVKTVLATDKDKGVNADLVYSIVAGNVRNTFSIQATTGLVKLNRKLDYEAKTTYALRIQAADKGSPSMESSVPFQVTVGDVNDNSPVFSPATYRGVVRENAPANSPVVKLYAKDRDSGNNGKLGYSIHSGDNDDTFKLDSVTGQLSVKTAPDFEKKKVYRITVKVEDEGSPPKSSLSNVNIFIEDLNDNTPTFDKNSYQFDVSEDKAVGGSVAKVIATDADSGPFGQVIYSIVSGNKGNAFGVDRNTGELRVKSALDRETQASYTLRLEARDGAASPRSSTTSVILTVTDVNDNAPVFDMGRYDFEVYEDKATDELVGTILATDKDQGQNGNVVYDIQNNRDAQTFSLDVNSGKLKLAKGVDRETQASYAFTVTARDRGNPSRSSTVNVKVTIKDVNDNAPTFSKAQYDCSVSENLASDIAVCFVTATDRDVGANGQLSYSISNGNDGSAFRMDVNTGAITTAKTLDRENIGQYHLTIVATDGSTLRGGPTHSATTVAVIRILDENDNEPKCEQDRHNFSVDEDVAVDVAVGPAVKAVDGDEGANGKVAYTLTAGNVGSRFQIDSQGVITVRSKLDRETRAQYTLTVTAEDGGNPSLVTTCIAKVTVNDVNDNGPTFSRETFAGSIREDASPGSRVLQVVARDKDAGSNGKITLKLTGSGSSNFSIDDEGFVYSSTPLDYETKSLYTMTVVATDGGNPPRSATAQIKIDIINVNDNVPVFEETEATQIREDVALGTQVVRMNATDSDSNQIQYSIIQGNVGGAFQIDQGTGLISVAAKLDRETRVNYTLVVEAKDTGDLSVKNNASIQVTDANDNAPTFSPPTYSARVAENRAKGQPLVTVAAKDQDEGSNAYVTFSISTRDTTKFEVDPKSGAISTKVSLDREEFPSYTLLISATDNGSPPLSATATVTVAVIDENDNKPTFRLDRYAVPVPENTASGAIILRVKASDPDEGENGRVVYSVVSGNNDGTFALNPSTGSLSLNKKLDREAVDVYNLLVQASDSASTPSSSTVNVVVTVQDENDNAPVFVPSGPFSVTENSDAGTRVGQVSATDADAGSNAEMSFSIVRGDDAGPFTIDSLGVISVNGSIDRETIARYQLRVRAKDKGSPALSTEKVFTVNVTDVDDNAPEFPAGPLTGKVTENADVGTSVITLKATDADTGANARISYKIQGGNKDGKFSIDSATGLITTAAAIDYEKNAGFKLTVSASDATHTVTASLVIAVEDLNDNTPAFSGLPYKASVKENLPALAPVFQVSASDPDAFGQLAYSLEAGNHSDAFNIDPVSGEVKTADILDRERISSYQLQVKVTDGGKPALASVATLTVDVDDENDNPPVFPSNTLTVIVSEDSNVGSSVLTLNATDADIGPNGMIRYRLLSSNAPFRVVPATGEIKIDSSLDRETVSDYVLICEAFDGGTPSLASNVTVRVTVSDVNDNDPKFSLDSYLARVKEGVATGTVVEEVIATDADSGLNGLVEYSIRSGNQDGVFIIGNSTGVVTVAKEIDREVKSSYALIIEATDHGIPVRTSKASLQIDVQDINDNAPQFNQSSLVGSVLENEPDVTSVMRIIAVDPDEGPNAEISYHLEANENTNLFSLNSSTGEIFTKTKLDRELQDKYTLKVSVSDQGSPRLTSFADVTVNVIDVDDNCPKFYPAEYSVVIPENLEYGTSVAQVTATDVDAVANERILYAIRSVSPLGNFMINITSGVIYVGAGSVDREISGTFELVVRAGNEYCGVNTTGGGDVGLEGGDDRLTSAVAVVKIKVTDKNDNPPDFTQKSYQYRFKDIAVTDLFTIEAKDKDLGDGSVVKYKLGDLRENADKKIVTVVAYDQGEPSLNRTADVVVITQINCEAMVFDVSENGTISTQTLCSFVELPANEPKTILVGAQYKMSCAANGNTKPEYRWMKDGRFVSNWATSGDYVINSATEDDEGGYACLASSPAGLIQSRQAQVIVEAPPAIVKQPENTAVQLGETAVLRCNASGDPAPRYQWYKNGYKMAEASGIKPKRYELVLDNAVIQDEAEYFCEASNSAGRVQSDTVSLKVYGKAAVVSMELTVDKPNKAEKCHMFEKDDLKKLLGDVLDAKVFFTKVNAPGMCEAHPCNSNPCLHGGECQEDAAGYKCLCKVGWSGNDCENDVNECLGGPCFTNGACRNRDGTYECVCPASRTGKNCELAAAACFPGRCGADEVCALQNSGQNRSTCVSKDFEIVIKLNRDIGKDKVKLFDLEREIETLIRATTGSSNENAKSKARKYRSTQVDYEACTVRITSVEENVKFVLICPDDVQAKMYPEEMQAFICGLMFKSGMASSCGGKGAMVTPPPPTTSEPLEPITVKLEFFAKKDGSQESLDANEVVEKMESAETKEALEGEGYTMVQVAKANKQEAPTAEAKTPVGLIVGMVVGLFVLIILVVVVVVVLRRRSRGDTSFKNLMQGRSVISRRESQENILQRESTVKEISRSEKHYLNAVYDEHYRDASDEESNEFMVEVNLGKKTRKTPALPTELLSAPWFFDNLTKDEAEDTMSAKAKPGTFLVRKTSSEQDLILSIKTPEGGPQFRHLAIKQLGRSTFRPTFGSMEAKEFAAVHDIVDHFKVSPIKFDGDAPDVVLTEPFRKIDKLV